MTTPGVIKDATEVHDELMRLVAPATPGSIEASSLSRKRNPTLFLIWICSVVSFFIFIVPILAGAIKADMLTPDLGAMLKIVGGAGLGSSFFALYTASDYIRTSTFDPRYNNTYLIRFALGVLSGIILAYFLSDFLQLGASSRSSSDPQTLQRISVAALALVGGYAAEAVAQILNRVSETLVALVSGGSKDKIDAAQQKATADAERKILQDRSATAQKLQKAIATNQPGEIDAVLNDLLKPR